MIKESKYFTSMLIDLSEVTSKEMQVKNFEIMVYKNVNGVYVDYDNVVVEAKKRDDFISIPSRNIVLKDVEVGSIYYFKIRANTENGASFWSELWSETAGDVTNDLAFDPDDKIIINNQNSIDVRQKITSIPLDIDRFEVAIRTATFTNIYDNEPTSILSNPDANVKPTKTIKFDDVENDKVIFSINDISELTWYFFYIRSIDTSGNISSNEGANNWHYIGYGRVKIPSDIGVIIDGDFEDVYLDSNLHEITTTHWEDGDQWGLRAVEQLQAIDTGEVYYPHSGKYMALSNANATFFNRQYIAIDPLSNYTLSYYSSYGYSASVNVLTNNHTWKVELKQYKEDRTFISTKTLLASETIKTKLTNLATWKNISLNIISLDSLCKYVLIRIYTQCADIAFDSIELKKGITETKTWVDGATYETHTQVFKEGLLTSWTVV